MAIPQDQEQLLQAIEQNFAALTQALQAVPPGRIDSCRLEGHVKGSQIGIADLLAYLLGWNERVLDWLDKDARGEPMAFPAAGFKWNELGRLAQKFYLAYAALDYRQRLERLHQVKEQIVAHLRLRDNAALYERPWYGKWTLGRMVQLNTAAPYANARQRLRQGLKHENP
ncbi:ClbS/DfsB family four-helix bundle protein [Pseudomonas sp. NFXW11]|uniref:ClbS/DfsB family four-helix bundle protein n=1 Tax=Pseudomonas sp. NFXW11 TaxID=2819531 RepID=UPI003CEBC82C